MFIVSKIISFFLNPLIWIFLGLVFIWKMKNKKRRGYVIAAWVLMTYVFTNSVVLHEVYLKYETPAQTLEKGKIYDCAIVLGGAASYDSFSSSLQLNQSAERLTESVILYKKGIVKKLLITGGSASILPPYIKEGIYVRRFWLDMGVPDSAIIVESESRNTAENAKFTREILEKKGKFQKLLLITSALHMPRSKMIFEKAGIKADIYPVDFMVRRKNPHKLNYADLLVPKTAALSGWEALIHEWFGLIAAKI